MTSLVIGSGTDLSAVGNVNVNEASAEVRRLVLSDVLRGPAIRAAISALELPARSHGLDAGCGIGTHTAWLADEVGTGGRVMGVDIAADLLGVAAGAAAHSASPAGLVFVAGDMLQMPFDDATFDWVWSADTVHGVGPDPMPAVREMVRVTRPGGRLALLFWSSQRLLPGRPLLEARLDAAFAGAVPYMAAPPETHFQRALGWLRQAGLESPSAQTFVADIQAPLDPLQREALAMAFDMLWAAAESSLDDQDRTAVQRLCRADSPDFIADDPGYAAFLTYTMFSGRVPRA